MTSISWRNGPILRNGAIGTEQACCCSTGPQCCCKADGTVQELTSGQQCDGTAVPKPGDLETADGKTVTMSFCGVSSTISLADFALGDEGAFGNTDIAPRDCVGSDGVTRTTDRFTFDVATDTQIICNRLVIYFEISISLISGTLTVGTGFFYGRMSCCGPEPVITIFPDFVPFWPTCCGNPSITLNCAP